MFCGKVRRQLFQRAIDSKLVGNYHNLFESYGTPMLDLGNTQSVSPKFASSFPIEWTNFHAMEDFINRMLFNGTKAYDVFRTRYAI